MNYQRIAEELEALCRKYPALAAAATVVFTRDTSYVEPMWRIETSGGASVPPTPEPV